MFGALIFIFNLYVKADPQKAKRKETETTNGQISNLEEEAKEIEEDLVKLQTAYNFILGQSEKSEDNSRMVLESKIEFEVKIRKQELEIERKRNRIKTLSKQNYLLKRNSATQSSQFNQQNISAQAQIKDASVLVKELENCNQLCEKYKNKIYVFEEDEKKQSVNIEQFKSRIRKLEEENQILKFNLEQKHNEFIRLLNELNRVNKPDLTMLAEEIKKVQNRFDEIQNKGLISSSWSTEVKENKVRDFSSNEFRSTYGDVAGYIDYIEYVRSHFLDDFSKLE